jgi:ADP-ribose pyrophosphatase YjhB (NUDIX family)
MISEEMNFCRRCGAAFATPDHHVYTCANGHVIYLNASPAVGIVLYNDKGQVLILERAINPGIGRLDVPGGFCDGAERLETALARELEEEVGLTSDQYDTPEFLLSNIDPYEYGGETLPVMAAMFTAHIKGNPEIHAADDAATATFIDLAELDLGKVHFPTVREALEVAKQRAQQK